MPPARLFTEFDMNLPRMRGYCVDRLKMDAVPELYPADHVAQAAVRLASLDDLAPGVAAEAEDSGMCDVRKCDTPDQQPVDDGTRLRELLVYKRIGNVRLLHVIRDDENRPA